MTMKLTNAPTGTTCDGKVFPSIKIKKKKEKKKKKKQNWR